MFWFTIHMLLPFLFPQTTIGIMISYQITRITDILRGSVSVSTFYINQIHLDW
jgi:hypothetical protein